MHDFPVPALPMTRYLNKKSVKIQNNNNKKTQTYVPFW